MKHLQTDLATLISSTFYLMSRYAHSQDKQLILAIHKHLILIEHHPDMQSETIRTTCNRLRSYWLHLLKKDTGTAILEENTDIPAAYSKLSFLQ
ncbi:MAG: hypothetical protein KF888_07760 [Nitrosomonas sp.]|nr:hypothetical protein [Nitrosomonas sp.]